MKRIWIAIAFLSLAIGLCTAEQIYLDKTYATITKYVDEEDTDAIVSYWHKTNDILYAFSDHKALDNLTEAINELDKSDNKKETLNEIRASAKTYYENQRITFSNIF